MNTKAEKVIEHDDPVGTEALVNKLVDIGYRHAQVDAKEAYIEAGSLGLSLWMHHAKEWRNHMDNARKLK